jgi:hypothetical protein
MRHRRAAGFLAVVVVAVVALLPAACSSGNGSSVSSPSTSTAPASTATSATTSPPSTTVPATTGPPDTVASGGCTGQVGFAEAAGEWVATNLRILDTLTVARFRRSAVDPTWAVARMTGPRRSAVVIAHCLAGRWRVAGGAIVARGVACKALGTVEWPADLKLCP